MPALFAGRLDMWMLLRYCEGQLVNRKKVYRLMNVKGWIDQMFDSLKNLKHRMSGLLKNHKTDQARLNSQRPICFCTLAIHAPYRHRARLLCSDLTTMPWIIFTDEPDDFVDLPVQAKRHLPTGPMAIDYATRLPSTGNGAAAYHDKRFPIQFALQNYNTVIYTDADSRIIHFPGLSEFPPGLAVLPVVRSSIAEHLDMFGQWRKPIFIELAQYLTGKTEILHNAPWCHESLIAVTKDGREQSFFAAWSRCENFLKSHKVYSGEGGVIGLASYIAGWKVNYDVLLDLGASIHHEGGGPKYD
jgi:hypothetical protein